MGGGEWREGTRGEGAGASDLPPGEAVRSEGLETGAGGEQARAPSIAASMGLEKDIPFGFSLCVLSPSMIHQ